MQTWNLKILFSNFSHVKLESHRWEKIENTQVEKQKNNKETTPVDINYNLCNIIQLKEMDKD